MLKTTVLDELWGVKNVPNFFNWLVWFFWHKLCMFWLVAPPALVFIATDMQIVVIVL